MSANDKTARVRIPRTAKGERPQNFSDPAIEKVLGIAVSLSSEVSVLRDRLDTIERLIERHGLFPRTAIDAYEPSAAEQAERASRRLEYLDRVLQAARREFDESLSGRIARPLDEIIADFAAKKI
jgi:hypothetical protein